MEIRFNLTEESLIKVLNFAAGERDDEKVLNYAQELTESTETNEKENNDERPYEVVKSDSLLTMMFGGFSNDKRKELIDRAKEYIKEYEKAYATKVNRKKRTVEVKTKVVTNVPSKTYVYPVYDHVWNKYIMKAWGIATYRGSTKDKNLFGIDATQPHDVVKGMEVLTLYEQGRGHWLKYKKGRVKELVLRETTNQPFRECIEFEKDKRLDNIVEGSYGNLYYFTQWNGRKTDRVQILSDTKAEYGGDES